MPVDPRTSLRIVNNELQQCEENAEKYNWTISPIDEENQFFLITMKSPIDNEEYHIRVQFDNYKEWPLLIEFIDPRNEQHNTQYAYPRSKGYAGGFFHNKPSICHPCSRLAYKNYAGLHRKWEISGWLQNKRVGTLININNILTAIYSRISNPDLYGGRMSEQ